MSDRDEIQELDQELAAVFPGEPNHGAVEGVLSELLILDRGASLEYRLCPHIFEPVE